jgi:hypothetical protein
VVPLPPELGEEVAIQRVVGGEAVRGVELRDDPFLAVQIAKVVRRHADLRDIDLLLLDEPPHRGRVEDDARPLPLERRREALADVDVATGVAQPERGGQAAERSTSDDDPRRRFPLRPG